VQRQGILVILGHKGSGKSQLARAFIAEQPRSVCIDTLGEYGGVIIDNPHDLADYLEQAKALPYYRVSYRDAGQHQIAPEQVFKMLHALRDCWLVLEEADKWFGPNRSADEVKWFLKYGRHNNVSVLLVTRRAAEQGPMGTSQADTIVSFHMHEPRDLDWVRSVGGDEARATVEALDSENYEWAYVLDTHDEIRACLDGLSEERSDEAAPGASPVVEQEMQAGRTPSPVEPAPPVEPVAPAAEPVVEAPVKRPRGRPRKVLYAAK